MIDALAIITGIHTHNPIITTTICAFITAYILADIFND